MLKKASWQRFFKISMEPIKKCPRQQALSLLTELIATT